MEQYFARQSANCCQLNFSNTLAHSPRYIISPKKTCPKPHFVTNKSAKKSLKAIPSHHTSKDNQNQTRFQQRKTQNKQLQQEFNDYGQVIKKKGRTENDCLQKRKELKFQAFDPQVKQFKSQQKKEALHSPNKLLNKEEPRNFRYSQKPLNTLKVQRIEQFRGSVLAKAVGTVKNIRQGPPVQQTVPYYYRQIPNNYISSTIIHPSNVSQFHQIPTYACSPIKNSSNQRQFIANSYVDQTQNIISNSPIVQKQSSTNYSQNFKRLYGEVEIEEEIKHDLMVSLEFNKNDYQRDNGVSMLTKCPPSQDSTILPAQSKLKHKFQYQIDSFGTTNPGRKSFTQKHLKAESFMGLKQQSLNLNGRQKFKSIVSVQSEHSSSSSQGAESVIIDHHPQRMLSANPIKSLL